MEASITSISIRAPKDLKIFKSYLLTKTEDVVLHHINPLFEKSIYKDYTTIREFSQ
jgi:hypothetical protein